MSEQKKCKVIFGQSLETLTLKWDDDTKPAIMDMKFRVFDHLNIPRLACCFYEVNDKPDPHEKLSDGAVYMISRLPPRRWIYCQKCTEVRSVSVCITDQTYLCNKCLKSCKQSKHHIYKIK